ncbi:MAG: FIST C-terminal domain-containing protein [Candidatus Omnitrophica bacterium]|nr:FIST C-terminal domain-containing protein [Candidatus Omnitrophota bacterium]
MTTIASCGVSAKLDSFAAGRESAQNAYYQLGRREPNIAIVFISTIFDQKQAIRGIRSVIKNAPLAGCSSAGSITSEGLIRGSVSVFLIYSDSVSISLGIGNDISKNARLAGHKAANNAFVNSLKDKTTKAYMMFSDSLSGNGANILRGAQEILGTSFPIIGGFAADELCFQKTYQYLNNNIYTDSVVGVLISGNINIGIGNEHGWQPIGKPHKITKARSNIIKEIDKKIAVEIYEDYLGKTLQELNHMGIGKLGISYPLGIKIKGDGDYLIRIPLRIEDDGGLFMSSEIPEGTDVNLMIGDKTLALGATRSACLKAVSGIRQNNIKFIAVFNDVARYNLLRKDCRREVEIIKEIFPGNIPIMGFYTYGEYTSSDTSGRKGWSNFQNQAFSIAVFSE